jgi:hypothetical protein
MFRGAAIGPRPDTTLAYFSRIGVDLQQVFVWGILHNTLLPVLPKEVAEYAKCVQFQGNASPSVPVNWRWTESISALKALEATIANRLLVEKSMIEPVEVLINTYAVKKQGTWYSSQSLTTLIPETVPYYSYSLPSRQQFLQMERRG